MGKFASCGTWDGWCRCLLLQHAPARYCGKYWRVDVNCGSGAKGCVYFCTRIEAEGSAAREGLEVEVDACRPHDGELVDAGEGEAVEVEDVVAVVEVGDAEVDFEDGAFAYGEFAFAADVEAVVVREPSGIEFAVGDAVGAVGAGVVGEEAVGEGEVFVHALCLCEGESAAEAPAAANFPLVLLAEADGGEEVDGVAAVVVGGVGLYLVGACDPAEGVGGPEVEPVDVVAEAHVEAVGHAGLDDEVGEVVFGFFVRSTDAVGLVVGVEHFVAVGVEELAEVFEIELGVASEVLSEVVFGADDEVLCALHAVGDGVVAEGGGFVEFARAGEEAAEEVDDVVVGACVEEYLAVEATSHFEPEAVGGVVFGGEARLEATGVERGVVDVAQAGVDEPVAGGDFVGGVGGDVDGVFVLFCIDAIGVVVLIVGGVAFEGKAVAQAV